MIEKAIEKIKREMSENKEDSYIQAIGDYLLKQVEINIDAVKKILSNDKSIRGSLEEIERILKKNTKTRCVCLSDKEVFKMVREYYKFEAVQDRFIQVEVEEISKELEAEEDMLNNKIKDITITNKNDSDISFNLEDYL